MWSASVNKETREIGSFRYFRQFLSGIRRRFQKKRRQVSHYFVPGLPAGITPDVLNTTCQDQFGEQALSYVHQHLSGWKSSGAFRLLIKTRSGKEIRLVYKDAAYYQDQIPALIDLPIRPGPPEYAVYSQPMGALAAFLPQVYLAEEISPGEHYRYLLEDLGQNHHSITGQKDFIQSSYHLPRLHQALREWSDAVNPKGFLPYGEDFLQTLQKYAQAKLENYSQHSDDPDLKSVLNFLPKVALFRLQDPVINHFTDEPIHGDTNFTNLHLHNKDPFQFRVVDWEWAGYGLPHADLASLLKGLPRESEKTAFQRYIEAPKGSNSSPCKDLSFEENWRLYLWAQLERGLLDASFLAVQFIQTGQIAQFSLPIAISLALKQVVRVYHELTDERVK